MANEPFFIKKLPPAHRYQHVEKVQRSLYGVLAMANSLYALEQTLTERLKLPEKNGIVEPYPRPETILIDYAFLIKESLIEAAVFVRAHDEFWNNKNGAGWGKALKRSCGFMNYKDGSPDRKNMTLKDACDKLIHQTNYAIGGAGDPSRFTVFLSGTKQNRKWHAELDVIEFCWIGLTYIR